MWCEKVVTTSIPSIAKASITTCILIIALSKITSLYSLREGGVSCEGRSELEGMPYARS
jgi:hypothetical protein